MPATDPSNKPMKKHRGRWWRWPLYALLVLAVAFGVFRYTVHRRVVNRLNAIRDAGYPVTLEELDAWYEYPDGPNAADVYQQAFDAYFNSKQYSELIMRFGDQFRPPRPGEKMPQEGAKRAAKHLQYNAETIALLEQAAKIQACRFPVDLKEGQSLLLPHLVKLKYSIRTLQLQSSLDADHGDYDLAADRCLTMIALTQAVKNEPMLISQLVSIGHQQWVYKHIERLIAAGEISDSRLQALAQAINLIDLDRMALRAMVSERCLGHDLFNDPKTLFREYPYNQIRSKMDFTTRRVIGLLDIDHSYYLDITQSRVDFAKHPTWPVPASLDDNRFFDQTPQYFLLTRKLLSATAVVYRPFFRCQAKQRVTLTGIATERYRQKHSQLPSQLQDLVPDYLDAVPEDPFTGKPLIYRLQDSGAIIYSLSTDGSDDGGRERDDQGRNAFSYLGTDQENHTDITFTFGGLQEKLWPSGEEEDEQKRE